MSKEDREPIAQAVVVPREERVYRKSSRGKPSSSCRTGEVAESAGDKHRLLLRTQKHHRGAGRQPKANSLTRVESAYSGIEVVFGVAAAPG